jgi:hypothetical protein
MTLQGIAIHHGTAGLMMRASKGRLITASPTENEVLPLYARPAGLAKANSTADIAGLRVIPGLRYAGLGSMGVPRKSVGSEEHKTSRGDGGGIEPCTLNVLTVSSRLL